MSPLEDPAGRTPAAVEEHEPAIDLDPSSPAALRADFLVALRSLTILRGGDPTDRLGSPALFYPLIGLLLGALVCAIDLAVSTVFAEQIASVMLVAILAVLSGGRHLDGFANTSDALIGFRGRDWALATIRDRRLGTFGAAAVFFLLILKVRSVDLLAEGARLPALLLSPMIGRWAMVVLVHAARAAGATDGRKFDPQVGFREFAVASVFSFLALFALAEAVGLLALIVVAAVVIGLRVYFHRRLGGITDQSIGAVAETAETLALMVFAITA